jgi:hypothetical protein
VKKVFFTIASCMLFSIFATAQSMGINTSAPHGSAILDIKSNAKGLLIPRMNSAQRNAVTSPAAGLLVFDLDKSTIYFFDGQKWLPMLFATSDFHNPPIGRSTSDGSAGDRFGTSVGIYGDYAIIGAALDDIGTKMDQGSAYIFARVDGVWVEQAKLTAPDGLASDHFGNSVSISGDYAIVGAPNGTGNWFLQGAAYIFMRNGVSWTLQAKLNATDGLIGDYFGTSVSISGDYAIVGAPNDGVTFASQGSSYVFMRSGTSWLQQSKLIVSYGEYNDNFGYSVSINGDYAVVGAPFRDANASFPDFGAAYIFVRNGSTWTLQADLLNNDLNVNDVFGSSVSISGGYAFIGTPNHDDAPLTNNGSVYVFVRNGVSWSLQAKLIAPDHKTEGYFGNSVNTNGDYAIIGSCYDDVGSNPLQGSAYIFRRSGTSWALARKVDDGNGQSSGIFGSAVAVGGFNYIIGAIGKNNLKGEVSFLNIE